MNIEILGLKELGFTALKINQNYRSYKAQL